MGRPRVAIPTYVRSFSGVMRLKSSGYLRSSGYFSEHNYSYVRSFRLDYVGSFEARTGVEASFCFVCVCFAWRWSLKVACF